MAALPSLAELSDYDIAISALVTQSRQDAELRCVSTTCRALQ